MIDDGLIGRLRMDDEQARHAYAFLHRSMRVVKECAVLVQLKLIGELFAGWNRILRQAVNAIHAVRHVEAVPMNACGLRQFVMHDDPHAVAFDHFNRGPRHTVIESPHIKPHVGQEFAAGVTTVEMKLFDALFHLPRQFRQVGRFD